MAQSVWRQNTGWTAERSDFESGQGQDFSLLHVVQTGFGAPLPSLLSISNGGSLPGSKEAGT
jgi:hypothetical protein